MEANYSNHQRVVSKLHSFIDEIREFKGKNSLDLKTLNAAQSALTEYINDLRSAPREEFAQTISHLNEVLVDIYLSKVGLLRKKESIRNSQEAIQILNRSLFLVTTYFIPEENKSLYRDVPYIFDTMFKSLFREAKEEVVGQEQRLENFLDRLSTQLKEAYNIDYTSRHTEIAAILYPIAILTAYLLPSVKPPQSVDKSREIRHDTAQFIRDYKAIFGDGVIYKYWNKDRFSSVLKQIWDIKRKIPGG